MVKALAYESDPGTMILPMLLLLSLKTTRLHTVTRRHHYPRLSIHHLKPVTPKACLDFPRRPPSLVLVPRNGASTRLPRQSVVLIPMLLFVVPENVLTANFSFIASKQQNVSWMLLYGKSMVNWVTTSPVLLRNSSTNLCHQSGILFNY